MVPKLIPFEKYQATGNDFILFDSFDFEWFHPNDNAFIAKICDRRFGIGADGVLILKPHPEADFYMAYYNSDGALSSFCGNGSRAAVQYAAKKFPNRYHFSFFAFDGPHEGSVLQNGNIQVRMKDIVQCELRSEGLITNTGSPHLIVPSKDPFHMDVNVEGKQRRGITGPEGINVNFVSFNQDEKILYVATYERGVEGETLACGTGVTAAAFAHCIEHKLLGLQNIRVITKGGNLNVTLNMFNQSADQVYLEGPAMHVFSGFIPA